MRANGPTPTLSPVQKITGFQMYEVVLNLKVLLQDLKETQNTQFLKYTQVPSGIVVGITKWYNGYGKQYRGSPPN